MGAANLCQPGGGASCGACCGLYNFRDHSRAALDRALRRQASRLEGAPRTEEAFRAAAAELRGRQEPPLFSDVRTCPLLGFLDGARTRVGCLAHPGRGGADLRDCGAYRAPLCQSFECPSFLWLEEWQARLVRDACPEWYLYGLVITDVELVRGCLRLVGDELGAALREGDVRSPGAVAAFARLFALKEDASGRDRGAAVFGRFVPDGSGDAALRTLDYRALGAAPAPEDDVVLCLGHAPRCAAALEEARAELRSRVRAAARAVRAATGGDQAG